jgi:hypothetical protein
MFVSRPRSHQSGLLDFEVVDAIIRLGECKVAELPTVGESLARFMAANIRNDFDDLRKMDPSKLAERIRGIASVEAASSSAAAQVEPQVELTFMEDLLGDEPATATEVPEVHNINRSEVQITNAGTPVASSSAVAQVEPLLLPLRTDLMQYEPAAAKDVPEELQRTRSQSEDDMMEPEELQSACSLNLAELLDMYDWSEVQNMSDGTLVAAS